jgi:hypothetical protein
MNLDNYHTPKNTSNYLTFLNPLGISAYKLHYTETLYRNSLHHTGRTNLKPLLLKALAVRL